MRPCCLRLLVFLLAKVSLTVAPFWYRRPKVFPKICSHHELKVGLSPSKKICVICLIESLLKMMKNAFYFILIAVFVLKVFKFLSRLFGHVVQKLTSKFMTSQPGLQTIGIHILPNISQSKSNQIMKFGQLIEYNKRNIFLPKLCGK